MSGKRAYIYNNPNLKITLERYTREEAENSTDPRRLAAAWSGVIYLDKTRARACTHAHATPAMALRCLKKVLNTALKLDAVPVANEEAWKRRRTGLEVHPRGGKPTHKKASPR